MKNLTAFLLTASLLLCNFVFITTIAADGSFDKSIYEERRQRLMEKMEGGIAIFKSAEEYVRNNDVEFPYRQDSDFYYLTGFEEKESAFLLIPGAEQEFIMFVRKRNPMMEGIDGSRAGIKGAMETFGADTAFAIDDFEKQVPRYARHGFLIY